MEREIHLLEYVPIKFPLARENTGDRIRSIHLQTHSVVDFVVAKCDVIFVDRVPVENSGSKVRWMTFRSPPFLQRNLRPICTSLGSNQLLQVAHGIVRAALDPDCKGTVSCRSRIGNEW